MFHQLSQRKCCVASNMMILEYYEKYGNFRDKIEIFILSFSCFETRSRLHIVILMFWDENEKLKLNFSRSSEKNLSQFSRDLARTRILADLWEEAEQGYCKKVQHSGVLVCNREEALENSAYYRQFQHMIHNHNTTLVRKIKELSR